MRRPITLGGVTVPIIPGGSPQPVATSAAPTPPGPPRTKNSTILWIAGALCVGLLLMFGFVRFLANASNSPDTANNPAAADVSKPTCGHKSGSRDYVATMTVTNSTDRARDYTITVAFLGGGGSQITTAIARVADLKPGQSAQAEAIGLVRESSLLSGCEVTTVRRV